MLLFKRPKKWFTFEGPHGETWTVYLTTRKLSPAQLKIDGRWKWGVTYFGGRWKNRIYIDAAQPLSEFLDTVLHEVMHVACRPLGLALPLDEAIVSETSTRLAPILEQLGMKWPEI